jgi:hypothetical protein
MKRESRKRKEESKGGDRMKSDTRSERKVGL